ncbi:MAG: alpha/beta fold hydrolase [Verrucomicrobiales bacterium]|nr:alpha/beta fold hydrolase [Verrucomicrobiales bacterium]
MSDPGPPIIALHGNLGSPADWEAIGLPGLRAIDLWDYSALSFFEFAHELATTLTHGLEKPILAGYSLGGRLALQAMAMHPERWSGAVIVSAHPGLCCVEDRLARRISDEIWAKDAREMEWGAFLEKWNRQPVLASREKAISGDQLALESKREAIALAFETWSLGRQEDLRRSLRSFHIPVLWITGEHDEKFTRLGSEMADVFSDFRQEIIPGCGHRVLTEKPEEVARLIGEVFTDRSVSLSENRCDSA